MSAQNEKVLLPVDAAYDRWSAIYDAYDNLMVFAATHAVESTLLHPPPASMFEFGCGTGRNLAAFRRAGTERVAGCDLSPGMLAVARDRNPGVELIQADMAGPLPLPDSSFEFALFCLSLEHVADLRPSLAEARRVVAPGGRLAIIEIHPFLSAAGVAAHFEDAAGEVRMPTFPHQFADYLNAFAAVGLVVGRCREWRPRDLGAAPPAKAFKRGLDHPIAIQFELRRAR